jgi:hypothetical protein
MIQLCCTLYISTAMLVPTFVCSVPACGACQGEGGKMRLNGSNEKFKFIFLQAGRSFCIMLELRMGGGGEGSTPSIMGVAGITHQPCPSNPLLKGGGGGIETILKFLHSFYLLLRICKISPSVFRFFPQIRAVRVYCI